MRVAARQLAFALMLLASVASAEDIEHGARLVARWCQDCHAPGLPKTKARQAASFEAIAAKSGISSKMIANFLLLPHATMPNPPLSKSDAEDIAAFIMQQKN